MAPSLDNSEALRREFAARLRALRRAFGRQTNAPGLTGTKFAEALGMSHQRYSRYERGEMEPPLVVLAAIRRLTGMSLCRLIADLPAGSDDLLTEEDLQPPVTMGMRIRWVRLMMAPSIEEVAELMGCTPRTWTSYEYGHWTPPVSKMQEFAHRFSVTLDFLYSGSPRGIPDDVRDELLRRHPELAKQSNTSTATDCGISSRRIFYPDENSSEA